MIWPSVTAYLAPDRGQDEVSWDHVAVLGGVDDPGMVSSYFLLERGQNWDSSVT
jgi:hypothetical protein